MYQGLHNLPCFVAKAVLLADHNVNSVQEHSQESPQTSCTFGFSVTILQYQHDINRLSKSANPLTRRKYRQRFNAVP